MRQGGAVGGSRDSPNFLVVCDKITVFVVVDESVDSNPM